MLDAGDFDDDDDELSELECILICHLLYSPLVTIFVPKHEIHGCFMLFIDGLRYIVFDKLSSNWIYSFFFGSDISQQSLN